jgi:hypothetical protein
MGLLPYPEGDRDPIYLVHCDACGCFVDELFFDAEEAEHEARERGWRLDRTEAYCPECARDLAR